MKDAIRRAAWGAMAAAAMCVACWALGLPAVRFTVAGATWIVERAGVGVTHTDQGIKVYPGGVEGLEGQGERRYLVTEDLAGVRRVFPIVVVAAIVAFWPKRRGWWMRAAVVVLAVPVAIGLLAVRVAILILAEPDGAVTDLIAGAAGTAAMWAVAGVLFATISWVLGRIIIDDDDVDQGAEPKAA